MTARAGDVTTEYEGSGRVTVLERPQEMPVLSLWQPWAQLIVAGRKTIETRSWSTKHRGPLALGDRYRDTVSGFEGTATAVYFFLHACERVLLEQYDVANADMKELSFDAPRLVHLPVVKEAPKERTLLQTKTGGGPNPPRRSTPLR